MAQFTEVFRALTGYTPFCWQQRLYDELCAGQLPSALDLPTGVGKTSVMPIWLIARSAHASLPRRLVYVVDRRAVVDQASEVAQRLAAELAPGATGVLADARNGLGLAGDAAFAVSTLRGQLADNRAWLADPTAPAIIVGTIDMIGSRLLFSGYGVSRGMRPYHAGLIGADALIVLDEAHLVPPFEALLRAIEKGEDRLKSASPVPAFRVLPLSATGKSSCGAFRLRPEEAAEGPVRQRIDASKHLKIESIDNGKLVEELAARAVRLGGEGNRVLVYCDKRDTARKVGEQVGRLLGKGKKQKDVAQPAVELLVGARRVRERETLKESPVYRRFLGQEGPPGAGPAFLVATAAGEVGVDLDADHLVCDLVAFERIVQRLGRVNRRGERTAAYPAHIDVLVDDKEIEEGIKKHRYEREQVEAVRRLLERLPPVGEERRDASPAALGRLRDAHAREVEIATSREPLRPALDRPTVEAWSMTSLERHTGRPEITPWLRGWIEEEEPDTTLLWRTYLPWRVDAEGKALSSPDPSEVEAFFEKAPPHLTEKLEVPASLASAELVARAKQSHGELSAHFPAAIVLGSDLAFVRALRREDLALEDRRDKARLDALVAGKIVVLSRDLGGLDSHGLLDKSATGPVHCLDGEGEDADAAWQRSVGYRVVLARTKGGSGDGNWRECHRFELGVGDRDEEPPAYVVEEHTESGKAGETNDERSSRTQLLDEHLEWSAQVAAQVARDLGLTGHEDILITAARLHDRGKERDNWQRYAKNGPGKPPLAKFTGRSNPDLLKIGDLTYRHEFGSLADAEASPLLSKLPEDERDLALHLIVAHHGHARPVIAAVDKKYPPTASAASARAAALRYARLQRQWGPWGLAWWEAVFRGIDWRASRLLDKAETRDREAT